MRTENSPGEVQKAGSEIFLFKPDVSKENEAESYVRTTV